MTVPQLFLADKLVTSHNPLPGMRRGRSRSGSFSDILPHSTRTTSPLPPSSLQSSTTVTEDALITSAPKEVLDLEPDPLPFAAEPIVATRPVPPPSYKSALQAVHVVQERPNTPELDPAGSSASSDTSDESLTDLRASPTSTKSRHVNPNIPLSKHKPAPCTLFYLANCKHGSDCKYGNDYILQEEHYEIIRKNAKSAPCPTKNRNEVCTFGDNCCYGHICPSAGKCSWQMQGRCKFRWSGAHTTLVVA